MKDYYDLGEETSPLDNKLIVDSSKFKLAGNKRHKNFNTPDPSYTMLCTPKILVCWQGHANLLYSNWLNYYVYQVTPYDVNKIPQ